MTDTETREWLHGIAPTPAEQRAIIIDLLKHANEDQMSEDDRVVCRKALTVIREEGGKH